MVLLINESAARKYWSSAGAAVGARLNLWGAERTVAGVIGDVRDMPWHRSRRSRALFSAAAEWYPQPMFLIARARVDPMSIVEPIRRALREIDAELPLADIRPLEAVAGAAIATRRLTLWLVASVRLDGRVAGRRRHLWGDRAGRWRSARRSSASARRSARRAATSCAWC